jgi:FKBP-type peptidyl-prolyl cis-trans isomerase FklB
MKKVFFSIITTLFFITSINAQQKMDSLSYSLGVLVAQNLKGQFENLDATAMAAAIDDVLGDKDLKIDVNAANQNVQAYLTAEEAKKSGPAIEEGKKFLEANGKREGVVTLPSGLQYEVMTKGEGAIPASSDKVKVHYHGMLLDGTVFDSSVDRGQPAEFGVTQVIAGWVEALQLMPTGSKWKLFIPSDLAYGPRGAGGKIGPFATLIFEVELLDIVK